MASAHDFLRALTIVLGVAAVTTVLFQRLRQPVVLGYILAGLIIGPHVSIPLVADPVIVQTLSELGVILLMFSLGLEFSIRKLVRVGPTAGITAVIQCSVMLWLGFLVGHLLGWTVKESLFAGGIIAISSTTIIAKAFDEQGIRGKLREIVVGVLIVEDLIAILLMAIFTAIFSGAGLTAGALAATAGKLAAFLVALLVVGLLLVPRTFRAIVRSGRPETILVASIGLCFGVALLATELGYSVALGAFIAGSLIAESGEGERVEHLIQPVRDMFAAIFFVSVGMLIEPDLVAQHWVAVVVLTLVVIVGKVVSVSFGAFLTGNGTRTSIAAGMSLAQIGEFSFIIAALGLSLQATRPFLYPIAVAVSAITTLTTPWLIRASGPVGQLVDRRLPRPLQTFATLYGSWVERLVSAPREQTTGRRVRRLVRALLIDAGLLAVLVIGVSVALPRIEAWVMGRLGLGATFAHVVVIGAAGAIALPFCLGIFRLSRQLGLLLTELALPAALRGQADLAAAPRRSLVVTLQLACLLLVATPLLAITQPFLPDYSGIALLVLMLATVGVAFWRSATNLQGHVRAGAEMIIEKLAAQTAAPHEPAEQEDHVREVRPEDALARVHELLPGLGEPESLHLPSWSAAVGQSLAELNLRGRTGATILAIHRRSGDILLPPASEILHVDDVLAITGTSEALDAARELLLRMPDEPSLSP